MTCSFYTHYSTIGKPHILWGYIWKFIWNFPLAEWGVHFL
jgi:hypothetical protein